MIRLSNALNATEQKNKLEDQGTIMLKTSLTGN
jgi:hypothetical protein